METYLAGPSMERWQFFVLAALLVAAVTFLTKS